MSIFIYKKTSMDLNKKHLLYLTVFFLFLSLNASGQSNSISGRVLNQNTKESVEYASVVLFKQDSVFLNGTTADSIGRFVFTNLTSDDYVLSVSCMGFEAKKILLQNLSESAEIDVLLNESVLSLGEIVISASSTINKINQRIVFPTKLQLNHSANGMQLLNTMMLPGLNINPMTNTISSFDGGKVMLQINGVNVTSEEIQTLQPCQIRRVEYLDYAGIRYGAASKIVNFIVIRDDKGGVIGVDLMNSLNILAGGSFLNNMGKRVEDKHAFLKEYKFTIAIENSGIPGYSTEKIRHPFLAQSLPVYWGDPDISSVYNPDSFVNIMDFSSLEEAVEEVIRLDNDDAAYLEKVTAPFWLHGDSYEEYHDVLIERMLAFFRNIFEQPLEKARRRTRYGRMPVYYSKMRNAFFPPEQHLKEKNLKSLKGIVKKMIWK